MEVAVERVELVDLGDVGGLRAVADVAELGEVHPRVVGEGLADRQRFEGEAHLVDVDHLAGGELADHEAAEGDGPDQALLSEPLQGVADRRPRDPQVGGEWDLREFLIGLESTVANRVAERVVDGIDERLVAAGTVQGQVDLGELLLSRADSAPQSSAMDLLHASGPVGVRGVDRTHCIQSAIVPSPGPTRPSCRRGHPFP